MKALCHSRALSRIFLATAFGLYLFAGAAQAQKPGGSITVGLELDIPGFDPLKVGVFDTAALTAAAALFDTLTTPRYRRRNRKSTRLNSSHRCISYAVFCLKKKKI